MVAQFLGCNRRVTTGRRVESINIIKYCMNSTHLSDTFQIASIATSSTLVIRFADADHPRARFGEGPRPWTEIDVIGDARCLLNHFSGFVPALNLIDLGLFLDE